MQDFTTHTHTHRDRDIYVTLLYMERETMNDQVSKPELIILVAKNICRAPCRGSKVGARDSDAFEERGCNEMRCVGLEGGERA